MPRLLFFMLLGLLALNGLAAEEKAPAGANKKESSEIAKTQNIKAAAGREDMLDEMEMLDGVTIMEVNEKGEKRWMLEGSSAKQSDMNHVRIFDVVVTLFHKDGSEVKLVTDSADVNRETGEIETENVVQILDGERTIRGRGMYIIYTKEKRECKLFHDVQIKAKMEKDNLDILKAGK